MSMNRHFVGQLVALLLTLFLLGLPWLVSGFFIAQIATQTLILGMVALSLSFLAGTCGMVSFAQLALYGVAGYSVAILTVSYGQPWWIGVVGALLVTVLIATLFGLIATRTQGLSFLMITLALAMLVRYYAEQDRLLTNGHTGINGVHPPALLADPTVFYYVVLGCAVLTYAALRYLLQTPLGLSLQGVRDAPRRMASLGYQVTLHRVVAFVLAGGIAGVAGVLGVWQRGAISPGTIDLTRTINILVIAVIGGLLTLEGAFIGSLFFVLVTTFASSFTDRFNTVIGLAFLVIALFLPDGLFGLWRHIRRWLSSAFLAK